MIGTAGARTARRGSDPTDDLVVADRIDATTGPEDHAFLVELLSERHPVHAGRDATTVGRLRGYAMAAFERVGLPDRALVFLIEELESGIEAYPVAAAARGLRGLETRERRLVPFLLRALEHLRDRDDSLSFATYRPVWPPPGPSTTALAEILRTIAWLGPHAAYAMPRLVELEARSAGLPDVTRDALRAAMTAIEAEPADEMDADCCRTGERLEAALAAAPAPQRRTTPFTARFEDQDGTAIGYRELFTGAPTIVVFFYTRCTNPNKCSLTITKLARLQAAIDGLEPAAGIRTAGITYDPAFDRPPRLRAYGTNRGMRFGPDHRLLRATRGWSAVRAAFDLGVSFGPATVNRHRIEAFVLDGEGRPARSFTRLQWDIREVLDAAIALA